MVEGARVGGGKWDRGDNIYIGIELKVGVGRAESKCPLF